MGNAAQKKLMKNSIVRWWPALVIAVAWFIFGAPYFVKGKVPFPSTYLVSFFAPWSAANGMPVKNNAMPDVITQIYPWKRVTVNGWKNGVMPLWNPYSFSGTSHVGNYQSAIFSPVNSLFFLLPEVHAWSLMILLQPLLAGLFMLLYMRSIGISREGSVVGSIAFMFCGFLVVWMAYGTLSYAVLVLPLILFGLHTYINEGKKWGMVVASTAVGASFLSGHFQMSLYVLLYVIMYLAYLFFTVSHKRRVWVAALLVIVGVLLASPQIFPAFKAYTLAVRSSLFLKGEVIPWQYVVTIFSPDFYGNPVTRNDWFGHYAEWASFIGVAPLFLALFAMSYAKHHTLRNFFVMMTVLPLFLAFQTPLIDLVFALKIPVLSTSAASRIIVLCSFSLAVLSGIGLDVLRRVWEARERKKIIRFAVISFIIVAVIWGVLIFIKPLSPEHLTVAVRNTVLPTLFWGITAGVMVLGSIVPKRYRIALLCLLVAATIVDSYRFASKWMPFDSADLVYPQIPVITKLQSLVDGGRFRVFGNIGNEVGSAFGIPLIEGYDAVYQQRYGELISAAGNGKTQEVGRSVVNMEKHGVYTEAILQLLGVKYYAHKKSDGRLPWAYPFWDYPQYNRVWEDEHFEIIENTHSYPKALLASSYTVETDKQRILDTLFSEAINPRETIILEEKPEFEPEAGDGVATISSYRPTEIVTSVSTSVPKLLFISDVYDDGWQAAIDGKPSKIYRAHYDFRAVAVPKGTHTIRMWYAPKSVNMGLLISGIATLGIVSFLFVKKQI
jgi:hypothetical protein